MYYTLSCLWWRATTKFQTIDLSNFLSNSLTPRFSTWIVSADGEERSLIFTEVRMGLFDLVCAKVAEAHKLMNEARELVKQDLDNLKDDKSIRRT